MEKSKYRRVTLSVKGPATISCVWGTKIIVPKGQVVEVEVVVDLIETIHRHIGAGFELRNVSETARNGQQDLLSIWFLDSDEDKTKDLEDQMIKALSALVVEWFWEEHGPIGIKR